VELDESPATKAPELSDTKKSAEEEIKAQAELEKKA
jgi:hypothetical protein